MGVVGRGGARFFHAFDENGTRADEYPHVFSGRDFDSVFDAAENFLAVVAHAESAPTALA